MQVARAARISARILLAYRLRTTLSALSVGLGVAALVTAAGSTEAARRDLTARIAALGTNVLTVEAGAFQRIGRRLVQVRGARSLNAADGVALERMLSAVQRTAGVAEGSARLSWRSDSLTAPVLGVDPDLFAIRGVRPAHGRLFNAAENRGVARVVVLGGKLAEEVFGSYNPVGETVRLGGAPYRVVGIAAQKGVGFGAEALDSAAVLPLRTALSRVLGRTWLDRLVLQLADSESLRRLEPAIATTVREHHRIPEGKRNDFTVVDPARILAMEYQSGELLRSLTSTVAGVSLATGGVGILAVMLLAVRERTREIGLRRALGASRRDILVQFLGEAALLSVPGGLLGAAAGILATLAACALLGWPQVLPWRATALGLAFSASLGVVAGVYPAIRAARLAPDTALRSLE
jgi:ABC-type antimicrobial peptide transport system permease subunit